MKVNKAHVLFEALKKYEIQVDIDNKSEQNLNTKGHEYLEEELEEDSEEKQPEIRRKIEKVDVGEKIFSKIFEKIGSVTR